MSTPPNPNKPHVCRRLFGAPRSGEPRTEAEAAAMDNAENYQKEMREAERQRARDRWNFDFETETPLEGNWEWEKVEPPPEDNLVQHDDRRPKLDAEMGNVQLGEEENHSL